MTIGKILIGGVGFAALAAASPSAAQYYPYGNAYGYGYGMNSQAAVNSCASAVQNRLSYNRGYYGGYSQGRVLSITRVDPDRNRIHVRGVATSGRVAGGLNLFGLLGSNYRADLTFNCSVDYRGRVRDVDLYRR